jgi:hypothetical protein
MKENLHFEKFLCNHRIFFNERYKSSDLGISDYIEELKKKGVEGSHKSYLESHEITQILMTEMKS